MSESSKRCKWSRNSIFSWRPEVYSYMLSVYVCNKSGSFVATTLGNCLRWRVPFCLFFLISKPLNLSGTSKLAIPFIIRRKLFFFILDRKLQTPTKSYAKLGFLQRRTIKVYASAFSWFEILECSLMLIGYCIAALRNVLD